MGTLNAQLVAVKGPLKGLSWRIGQNGLLFGRSAECDIALPDPEVSRKHCRVFPQEGALYFEDLGGRNPALVNGFLSRGEPLEFGDEMAVGASLFVLARAGAVYSGETATGLISSPTRSWHGESFTLAEGVSDESPLPLRPRSTEDLALLCEATIAFSQCSDLRGLLGAAEQFLRCRFVPFSIWIALVYDEDSLAFLVPEQQSPENNPSTSPDKEALCRAARERKGLLIPRAYDAAHSRQLQITLVAPGVHASKTVLVVAIQNDPKRPVYDEDDLRVLILLTRALSPFVRAVQHIELMRHDLERLRMQQGDSTALVGSTPAMRQVRARAKQAARTSISTLITGETGTGKELVARAIHEQSARHDMPLVVVNCAAIPRELFEGEIFGYERGAYTGAHKTSPGLLVDAHGGTLFLDEIGDLSLENQARILRVVENQSFRKLGGRKDIKVDIRFLAATNHDLRTLVHAGKFRDDLYHRINAMEITLPPLRDHRDDIPELADHFFQMFKHQAKRPLVAIDLKTIDYLQSYSWPGNVRQLRNVIHRAVTIARNDTLRIDDIADTNAREASLEPELSLAELERTHITKIFQQCQGNIQQAAAILGIARSTLYKKLTEYGK